jgi:hypothetical protein
MEAGSRPRTRIAFSTSAAPSDTHLAGGSRPRLQNCWKTCKRRRRFRNISVLIPGRLDQITQGTG